MRPAWAAGIRYSIATAGSGSTGPDACELFALVGVPDASLAETADVISTAAEEGRERPQETFPARELPRPPLTWTALAGWGWLPASNLASPVRFSVVDWIFRRQSSLPLYRLREMHSIEPPVPRLASDYPGARCARANAVYRPPGAAILFGSRPLSRWAPACLPPSMRTVECWFHHFR